jgi:hypothetical protein
MKQTYRSFFFFVVLISVATMLLSACGAVTAPAAPVAPGSAKVDASIIGFTGVIESMNGNEWVINGQTLTVDPATVRGGPFQVGDQVKVEGVVNPDGSVTVSSVESPSAADLTQTPAPADNTNANTNDANVNDGNDNEDNDNDANINNGNDNDDDDGQAVSNANTNGSQGDHSHDNGSGSDDSGSQGNHSHDNGSGSDDDSGDNDSGDDD